MPRPEARTITFTIDGREVRAPENTMLVDAAKHGDVEIPVFCYEPKLGGPVGACRMCLVEIEGIPKLQTGCSTPVKDGMVVYTQTERVKIAQQSVVEFLLINHPLDCPVCDKGGECPLQDITFGWGGGISRFIEPKRHFVKPLELSPLIAIDRERCILCYRCVRFSQEVAEDYQLVLLERGAHSYVATFDGHPYVAPVQRQHRRAVPRRSAHLAPLPLPRAAVGHRGRRLGLHVLPRAVQRQRHGPRRARPARAGARERRGRRRLAVRQGPLRLPVLPRRGAHHRAAAARRGHPAPGLLGARARGGRTRALPRRLADGGARGRRRHQRGGAAARPADARGPRLPPPGLAPRRIAAAGAPSCARRSGAAGAHERPRARPRGARARRRADPRRADPRPAPAQGRAPPPRAARRGLAAGELARPRRGAVGALRARGRSRLRDRPERGPRRAAERGAGAPGGSGGDRDGVPDRARGAAARRAPGRRRPARGGRAVGRAPDGGSRGRRSGKRPREHRRQPRHGFRRGSRAAGNPCLHQRSRPA